VALPFSLVCTSLIVDRNAKFAAMGSDHVGFHRRAVRGPFASMACHRPNEKQMESASRLMRSGYDGLYRRRKE
jgi:hypothetical protein